MVKASTYRSFASEQPKVVGKKRKTVFLTREQRLAREAESQMLLRIVQAASELMNHVGVPASVNQVPEWMMPLGGYSLRFRITDRGFPEEYHQLYAAIRAAFHGDFNLMELWELGHGDD